MAKIVIHAMMKYLLYPILSTKRPNGALKQAATMYVIMIAFPADF